MNEQVGQPTPGEERVTRAEHRRALRRFRTSLDDVLEWFAVVEALPSRRADDQALRDAIQQAKPPIATIVALLERMEQPDPGNQEGA